MGEKNWPKSAKKCQKEPKFVFRAQAPLPAPQVRRRCGPEGPAPEAPRLPAEGRQASIRYLSNSTNFTSLPLSSSSFLLYVISCFIDV